MGAAQRRWCNGSGKSCPSHAALHSTAPHRKHSTLHSLLVRLHERRHALHLLDPPLVRAREGCCVWMIETHEPSHRDRSIDQLRINRFVQRTIQPLTPPPNSIPPSFIARDAVSHQVQRTALERRPQLLHRLRHALLQGAPAVRLARRHHRPPLSSCLALSVCVRVDHVGIEMSGFRMQWAVLNQRRPIINRFIQRDRDDRGHRGTRTTTTAVSPSNGASFSNCARS